MINSVVLFNTVYIRCTYTDEIAVYEFVSDYCVGKPKLVLHIKQYILAVLKRC